MADGAARADLIISTGGASGSETDHVADAIRLAGGSAERLSIAVKPGKALVVGSIGSTIVLGLPGNPLAAMVGFLLFGRPLAQACVGVTPSWPRGEAAIAARPIRHSPGRTEFVPARIVATPVQGPLLVESCGAGSARLLPLVNADGLVEIEPECDGVAKGSAVIFHPFHAELAL
jgi:molybdopterin molybdotransferase